MANAYQGLSKPDLIAAALTLAQDFVDRDATYVDSVIYLQFETHQHAVRKLRQLREILEAAIAVIPNT